MRKIAVIGLTTLEYIAIKSISDNSSHSYIERVNTSDMQNGSVEHFDKFVVSADIFANYTDFFLPRKGKTIILCEGTAITSGNIISVGRNGDLIDVISTFEKFFKESDEHEETSELSSREIEVLKELAKGHTIKEIADKLCISANTASSHRKNISSKLGIRSVSGLSVYAIMHGLI